jgi:hypothetical protein
MTLLSSLYFNTRFLTHFLFNHVTIQKPVQFQGIVLHPSLVSFVILFPASNCSDPAAICHCVQLPVSSLLVGGADVDETSFFVENLAKP